MHTTIGLKTSSHSTYVFEHCNATGEISWAGVIALQIPGGGVLRTLHARPWPSGTRCNHNQLGQAPIPMAVMMNGFRPMHPPSEQDIDGGCGLRDCGIRGRRASLPSALHPASCQWSQLVVAMTFWYACNDRVTSLRHSRGRQGSFGIDTA